MMKNLSFSALLLAALIMLASCSNKKQNAQPGLEVTANNISGVWQLASWSGADEMPDSGAYVYIEIERRDQKFTLYQNIDSFSARRITGTYNIYTDEEAGAVIRGRYDYGTGDWQHRYIVRDLTPNSMTWVAKDAPEDVSVYVRCKSLPDFLLNDSGQ